MNAQEREELRDVRERLIKLETTINLEFKHLKEDWKMVCESVNKLNEEYGRLLQKHVDLELKVNKSISNWKFAALVISPIITTVIITAIHYLFNAV